MRDQIVVHEKGYRCELTVQTTDIETHVALTARAAHLRVAVRAAVLEAVATALTGPTD